LEYFWSLNVKQFEKHVKVYNKKQNEEIRRADMLNYMLGKYIAFAFNDPKKYPNKPFLESEEEIDKEMSAKAMERQAMYNTAMMGGVIK